MNPEPFDRVAYMKAYRQVPAHRLANARRQNRLNSTPEGRAARVRYRQAARDRHRERIATAKAVGCADCGATSDLRFHHLDPSTKSYRIADMGEYGDETFATELAKCVVVCEPCHVERHREMSFA